MRLLRLEGVNIAHSVDDTEDLATRRGGSLMLLEATSEVQRSFGAHLEEISTGASIGLFEVTSSAPADLAAQVRRRLSGHPLTRCGTFVVDETSDEFRPALEQVMAANRWRQMRSLSFSPTGLSASSSGPCVVEGARPALASMTVKGQPDQAVSTSVHERRSFGMARKGGFYAKLLGTGAKTFQAAETFEDIARGLPPGIEPPTLDGKIAVFYADGNRFSRFARGADSGQALGAWDTYIKARRKELLAAIVDRAGQSTSWHTASHEIRLETLLWGGDEVLFVVPAWCGLELASIFFEATTAMQYPVGAQGERLTHACGLVFCHHQAPISRIAALARALSDRAKLADDNRLVWIVLESFDHAGGDLDAFLERRFGVGRVGWQALSLGPENLATLRDKLPNLKETLPRSAIVRVVRMMAHGSAFDAANEPDPLVARAYASVAARLQAASTAVADFGAMWQQLHPTGEPWDAATPRPADLPCWVKLVELWDYAGSPRRAAQ